MKTRNPSREPGEHGVVWYVIPAVCVVVAVAGALVLSYGPALQAESGHSKIGASAASSTASLANNYFPVPAASTVFTERTWDVSEQADRF